MRPMAYRNRFQPAGSQPTRTNVGFKEEAPDGTCADTPDDDSGLAVGSALDALGHDANRSSPSPSSGASIHRATPPAQASDDRHAAFVARLKLDFHLISNKPVTVAFKAVECASRDGAVW